MAARNLASRYRCTECSAESLKWLGRCASCQAWGTVEELSPRSGAGGFAGRAGAVVRLAGEPGVGKSTLLLAVAAKAARAGQRVLVVTGEETAAQVQSRAARIGALAESLYLAAETDLGALVTHVEQVQPSLLIVD